MEIWGCRLNFRKEHVYCDISIEIYRLVKYIDDFFWSFEGCYFICCNRNSYDLDTYLYKQKCKEHFKARKNFYLLDFVIKADPDQSSFNESQLNRQIYNADLDTYIDNFFKRVKIITNGASSHSC